MSEHVGYGKAGAVATLRFNRPEKKNAITSAMYLALVEALEDAAGDENIRAVAILGGEVFTAGNDIGDFIAAGGAGGATADFPAVRFLRCISAFPKPLVVGVKGVAVGIGTTLLMHCDAVVAGTSARFSLPFTKLGLVPEAASSVLFPLIAGRMRASWLLLTGESFGAEEARELGLVTRVKPDEDVDAEVASMCATLADLPPISLRNTKRLLKTRFAPLVDAAMEEELAAFAVALQSDEARAAFMKFMQR